MTTLLPPVVPSLFGKPFHQKPYIFSDLSFQYPVAANASAPILHSSPSISHRQVSPSSVNSVASAPLTSPPRNDENQEPNAGYLSASESLAKRATSLRELRQPAPSLLQIIGSRSKPALKVKHGQAFSCKEAAPVSAPTPDAQGALSDQQRDDAGQIVNDSQGEPSSIGETGGSISPETKGSPRLRGDHNESHQPFATSPTVEAENKSFRHWANSFRRKKRRSPPRSSNLGTQDPAGPTLSENTYTYRKRLSNASSGLVETVKTASLSNASVSVIPRSRKQVRSSELRGNWSSSGRLSADSDRPTTRSSLDEAAICRGSKRRQILKELLISEESYVADLKALSNLFSTLLASVPSLSTRKRSSIQRNVGEILQLHEQLISDLHRVTSLASSRESKHATRSLATPGHIKWLSLDSQLLQQSDGRHHPPGTSADDAAQQTAPSTADPLEALEVAQIIKHLMVRFFAYEEYCANYKLMVHELAIFQKSVLLWPLYETGIEALARSIRAIDQLDDGNNKGMTVGDLLISPIQRLTKYPLLLADLHKNTPVIDCPSSHAEIDTAVQYFKETLREINHAADDPAARERIKKRWLLQERLTFNDDTLQASQFRLLGHPYLCGVLHIAYQSQLGVEGRYGLCVLFQTHLMIGVPVNNSSKFEIIALIHLSDLKIESTCDGRGLQCHTALFSWKVVFESDKRLFEIILSACSAVEEDQWKKGLQRQGEILPGEDGNVQCFSRELFTTVSSELKSCGVVFGQADTLARRLSIQRAATIGKRPNICQVIIRNTHKAHEPYNTRGQGAALVNRSHSLLTTHRIAVLAPKRSTRIQLEISLASLWTRDRLPYPGMAVSRSGKLIRASAGSLVRKLSFASIHSPFIRRSTSLTVGGRASMESLSTPGVEQKLALEYGEKNSAENVDLPEETLGAEAIDNGEALRIEYQSTAQKMPFSGLNRILRRGTRKKRKTSIMTLDDDTEELCAEKRFMEGKLGSKKRWSNSLGLLKGLSADRLKDIIYSSK